MDLATFGLPVALVFFIVFAGVLPVARLRVRTGVWAVVIRESQDSVEAFVRWWAVGLLAAVTLWVVLYSLVGGPALAVWQVPDVVPGVGVGLMALGLLVAVIAQAQMGSSWRIGIDDRPTELVTGGLFAWIRNPIYTGMLAMLAGIMLMTPSPWTVSGFVLGFVLIAIQTRLEEQHLRVQHPVAFLRWASGVGRFVPGVGKLADPGGRSSTEPQR